MTGGEAPKPLWSGRFSKEPATEASDLGASLHFDKVLAGADIEASIAHARALEDAGLLSPGEATSIVECLEQIRAEGDTGRAASAGDEDIHMFHERVLTESLGDTGAKIHAGRSRNDLVATDERLWLLEGVAQIADGTAGLATVLASAARQHSQHVMPGLTHNRPAQVVTLGYVLAAHGFAFLRDLERLDQWADRASVSPLGAGAIATSTLGLDPDKTAARLGFERAFENALDAVADRDFLLEFLSDASILALHLSRLAADFARWSDPAVGYARLDEAYSTGSSMMPQKRNPDVLELARGKSGRIIGGLVALTQVLAGLPLGYHRDMQEDKEPVFDAWLTLQLVLPALVGCVSTTEFDTGAMRRDAQSEELYATDLAEALVKQGVPFRESHVRIGALLRSLDEQGRSLRDLDEDEWEALGAPHGGALLDPDHSIAARSMAGGPSPDSVIAQAGAIEAALAERKPRA